MSVFGMGAVGVGGLVVVGLLLVAVAAATGWLTPGPGPSDGPVVVDDSVPQRFRDAPSLPDADQQKVQRAARAVTDVMSRRCGGSGQVSAEVLVDRGGQVVFAVVEPPGGRLDAACLKKGLEKVTVKGGVSREGRARLSLRLP